MILIITTILSILVVFNFLLLIFSCNKTTKKEIHKEKAQVIKARHTIQHSSSHLAPTGS